MTSLELPDHIWPSVADLVNRGMQLELDRQKGRHAAKTWYYNNLFKVRRRQLIHNLNNGRTKEPTLRSLMQYAILRDANGVWY